MHELRKSRLWRILTEPLPVMDAPPPLPSLYRIIHPSEHCLFLYLAKLSLGDVQSPTLSLCSLLSFSFRRTSSRSSSCILDTLPSKLAASRAP